MTERAFNKIILVQANMKVNDEHLTVTLDPASYDLLPRSASEAAWVFLWETRDEFLLILFIL